jgi:transcriptional regulator with XRE-family HTH domain
MDYSPEKFFHQLTRLKEQEKITTWEKFEREYGMRGSISRWKTGKDAPTPASLLRISQRFQVSIDWLLRGEEGLAYLFEHAPERYQAKPPELSLDYLTRAARLALKYFQAQGLPLKTAQVAELIAYCYEYLQEKHQDPGATTVHRLAVLILARSAQP